MSQSCLLAMEPRSVSPMVARVTQVSSHRESGIPHSQATNSQECGQSSNSQRVMGSSGHFLQFYLSFYMFTSNCMCKLKYSKCIDGYIMMKGKFFKPSAPCSRRNHCNSSLCIRLPEMVYACVSNLVHVDSKIYKLYHFALSFHSTTYLGVHSLSVRKEVIYSF